MAGWGGPVCQPGSSLGPNAAQASSCSPQSQAAGTQPLPTEVGAGRCCGVPAAAGLALTWSVSQSSTSFQNAKHPAGLCVGLAGKKEASKGRRQHCRLFGHKTGTAAGEQHYPSQPLASTGLFCPASDSLSVLLDEQSAQSTLDLCGQSIYHQHRKVPVKVADQSFDTTDFRKNTASLTKQHCNTALPALTVHPRMHPSPIQHPLSSCPNAGTSLRTASEVPFGE